MAGELTLNSATSNNLAASSIDKQLLQNTVTSKKSLKPMAFTQVQTQNYLQNLKKNAPAIKKQSKTISKLSSTIKSQGIKNKYKKILIQKNESSGLSGTEGVSDVA